MSASSSIAAFPPVIGEAIVQTVAAPCTVVVPAQGLTHAKTPDALQTELVALRGVDVPTTLEPPSQETDEHPLELDDLMEVDGEDGLLAEASMTMTDNNQEGSDDSGEIEQWQDEAATDNEAAAGDVAPTLPASASNRPRTKRMSTKKHPRVVKGPQEVLQNNNQIINTV